MNKQIFCFTIIALVALSILPVFSQVNQVQSPDYQVTYLLEDFDPETKSKEWSVKGSEFTIKDFPTFTYVSARPKQLFLSTVEGKTYNALGIRSKFSQKGYNTVEIIPNTPLAINGVVDALEMWVWGANYNYDLSVCLRDFNGVVHQVPMGRLNFLGWKNLKAKIPPHVPQLAKYIPNNRYLQIIKFVITTAPKERVDDFFCYFDELKANTNIKYNVYDGDVLAEPDNLNDTWGEGTALKVSGSTTTSSGKKGGK